jgi:hypothetical protein
MDPSPIRESNRHYRRLYELQASGHASSGSSSGPWPAAAAAADPIWVGASQRLVLSRLSASAASALDRFCNFKFEPGMAV